MVIKSFLIMKDISICDPTYINADYGMAMPDFKNVDPKVVVID